MLSYRHAFHAGNFADVFKHFMLVYILNFFNNKKDHFIFYDCNAGAGLYSISDPFMDKNKEYENGITKILTKKFSDNFINNYLDIIKKFNPSKTFLNYPGSPYIAKQLLKKNNIINLFELHPADFKILKNNFLNDGQVKIFNKNSYNNLVAKLKSSTVKKVVLIDPSYELSNEYLMVLKLMKEIIKIKKITLIVWYPVLNKNKHQLLTSSLKNLNHSHIQLVIDKNNKGLKGSGLIIINPPWRIENDIKNSLRTLFENFKINDDLSKLTFENSITSY
jgi:23S rRNA (adenine2030-N6)-methyltransferase